MSERGAFDARLWVTGEDARDVYRLLNEWLIAAREVAPEGVEVRYTQLRPARRTRLFHPTLGRRRRTA